MEYFIVRKIDEAFRALCEFSASGANVKLVAGGTDLAVQIADGALHPQALVDITGIPELGDIRVSGERLAVGGAVTIAKVAERDDLPACLVQGAGAIGSPQIRNLGTIGGNVCNASPCGDTLAPLLALDARLLLRSPDGERTIDAKNFFLGPKKTVLMEDELLVEILVDRGTRIGSSAFRMIGKRNGQVISQVNTAVWLRRSGRGGTIEDIRVAFGSVAPTPIRLAKVEGLLRGTKGEEKKIREAQNLVVEEIAPISDVRASEEYRHTVARALFREALEEALSKA